MFKLPPIGGSLNQSQASWSDKIKDLVAQNPQTLEGLESVLRIIGDARESQEILIDVALKDKSVKRCLKDFFQACSPHINHETDVQRLFRLMSLATKANVESIGHMLAGRVVDLADVQAQRSDMLPTIKRDTSDILAGINQGNVYLSRVVGGLKRILPEGATLEAYCADLTRQASDAIIKLAESLQSTGRDPRPFHKTGRWTQILKINRAMETLAKHHPQLPELQDASKKVTELIAEKAKHLSGQAPVVEAVRPTPPDPKMSALEQKITLAFEGINITLKRRKMPEILPQGQTAQDLVASCCEQVETCVQNRISSLTLHRNPSDTRPYSETQTWIIIEAVMAALQEVVDYVGREHPEVAGTAAAYKTLHQTMLKAQHRLDAQEAQKQPVKPPQALATRLVLPPIDAEGKQASELDRKYERARRFSETVGGGFSSVSSDQYDAVLARACELFGGTIVQDDGSVKLTPERATQLVDAKTLRRAQATHHPDKHRSADEKTQKKHQEIFAQLANAQKYIQDYAKQFKILA